MRTSSTLGKGLLLGGVAAFVGGFGILFTPVSNAWMTAVAWVAAFAMMVAALKVIAEEEAQEESQRDFLMMQRMEKFRKAELEKKKQGGTPGQATNTGPQGNQPPNPPARQRHSGEVTPPNRGATPGSQENVPPRRRRVPDSRSSSIPEQETEEQRRERRRLQREEIRNRHRAQEQGNSENL